jgi:predicted ATPase/Tfp pilus assembly protein PilF
VVAGQLSRLKLLLVLDNFEHLLAAAADVGRLAASGRSSTVLVTSRSALRVRGEREYPVGPLSLPIGQITSARALVESASGAFVLHRALEASAPLTLDDGEVQALGALCHRLAGLPLAIELATPHLRTLSPQTLLERLDEIATSGPRDLPSRQRSMRATLDWSYRLLTAEEQRLFRLLGVFRGGATLTAIEDLAAESGILQRTEVVGLLEVLVENSLVVVRPGEERSRRYEMLEPVAQYARSLLIGKEAIRAGKAHARVFLRLTEDAALGYSGSEQLQWLNRVQADEANILLAIDRSLDAGDGETAGRITWSMWLYWWLRSQPLVGLRRATRCLATPLSPPVLARVHLAAATSCYAAGDMTDSADHWQTAFRLGTEQHDLQVAGAGRTGTGLAALGAGDLDRAEDLFREALLLTERAGDVWLTSLIHVWLGTIFLAKENPASATVEIEQGLDLARDRGDRMATYVALYNLAQAATSGGDHDRARRYLSEGIDLSEQTQDLANLAYFLEALAIVESAENAMDRVPVLLGAAQHLRETMKDKTYGYYLPNEPLREQVEQQARRVLGEDAYNDGVTAGRRLDPAGSVRFALR